MKIGLALSGGGSRGFAHLGVIKAMYSLGIKPNKIAGSSAGALVGALIAEGYSPDYLFEIFSNISLSKAIKPAFNKYGLFSLEPFEKVLDDLIPHNSFENLSTDLVITATNIHKSKTKYFTKGNLKKCVIASCSIPGIFKPIKIKNTYYVDGGISDNLPIKPLLKHNDMLIGVNIMPKNRSTNVKSVKDVLLKSLFMSISHQTILKKDQFDLYIEPNHISHFNGLSLKDSEKMFKLGYETALPLLEQTFKQHI